MVILAEWWNRDHGFPNTRRGISRNAIQKELFMLEKNQLPLKNAKTFAFVFLNNLNDFIT